MKRLFTHCQVCHKKIPDSIPYDDMWCSDECFNETKI